MIIKPTTRLAIDGDAVLKEAVNRISHASRSAQPARRDFLRRSLTLGGLAMLTGCTLVDEASIETALTRISRMNDKVQGWLFDPNRLAPTYPDSMITRPFPFNAYYGEDEVREVEESSYRLEVTGLVADKRKWALSELRAMPQIDQVTRHICVERWSAIGKWGGVSFARFLRHVGADLSAKYVGFKCADDYFTSIDMPTALHPQTVLALTYDGQALPPKYGFPMKLRMPTKLGYKNPKHIQAIFVTNTYPGGYWEDQGYNWFGGSRVRHTGLDAVENAAVFLVDRAFFILTYKDSQMNKLSATLIATCLAIGSVSAFAADEMKKDEMAKDSMAKDSMAKDGMKKDGMKKDAMGKDSTKKDSMAKDAMGKDAMGNNAMGNNATSKSDGMAKDEMKK